MNIHLQDIFNAIKETQRLIETNTPSYFDLHKLRQILMDYREIAILRAEYDSKSYGTLPTKW